MKYRLISGPLLVILPMAVTAQQITAVRDTYPSVSPDGQTVVFQSNRSGRNEIWRMKRDGSGLRQLTHTDHASGSETPVWSPDGQRIAFARYLEENNNDVFVMDLEGGATRQLTDSPGYDGHPHWSADGLRIVFNSDRTSPDLTVPWGERWHEIHSISVDGDDLRQHTTCRAICTYGSLSPDGQQILYRRTLAEPGLSWSLASSPRNSEVFVTKLRSGESRNLSASAAFDGWPIWSPDGRWIAFASNRSGPPRTGQIWIVRPDGSGLREVTTGALSHVQPSWAPDGRALWAYRAYESASIEFGGIARVPALHDPGPSH